MTQATGSETRESARALWAAVRPAGGRGPFAGILFPCLAISMALATTISVSWFRSQAERALQTEVLLERMAAGANELNAREWEAISIGRPAEEARESIRKCREGLTDTLKGLKATSPLPASLAGLHRVLPAYLEVLEAEFALLEDGRFAEAIQLDAERVDPAFDRLLETIQAASVEHGAGAQATLRRTSWGTAAVVLFSMAVISILFWNVSRTARRAEIEALGRKGLEESNARLQIEVAERLRVEDELRAAKESAESANRLKSEFLANMSHEFRTPMNGVIGMAELLQLSPLDAEQAECARTIRESAEALLTLINDILDFSRLESGTMTTASVEFCPEHELGEMAALLEAAARRKGLRIGYQVLPGTPRSVTGDRTRIRQILTNLLGNAVKFTEGGEVSLSCEVLSERAGGVVLRFRVSDTGPGIAADLLPRLFSDFTQLDGSRKRRHGGIGLGLALVRRLTTVLGGRVDVTSEPGKGSTFTVDLPLGVPALGRPVPEARALERA